MYEGLAHHILHKSFSLNTFEPLLDWIPFVSREHILDSIQNEINHENPQNILFSSEVFSPESVYNISNSIENKSLKIIYFVRRIDLLIDSIFIQSTKHGYNNHYPDAFFNERIYKNEVWGRLKDELIEYSKMGAEIIIKPFEKNQMKDGLINTFLKLLNLSGNFYFNNDIYYNHKLHSDIIYLILQRKDLDRKLIGQKYYRLIEFLSKYKFNELENNHNSFFSPHQRLTLLNEMRPQYEYVANNFLKRSNNQLFFDNEPCLVDNWTPPREINKTDAAEILLWLWDQVWEDRNLNLHNLAYTKTIN